MWFIGADPDLHTTALARVDEEENVQDAWMVTIPKDLLGREASAVMSAAVVDSFIEHSTCYGHGIVESQQIIKDGPNRTRNPDDILMIAAVSGALCGCLWPMCDTLELLKPSEWKGSVPKVVHQARVLDRLGWAYETRGSKPKPGKKDTRYCVPTNPPKHIGLKVGEWKHAVDAIGMALEALDRWKRAQRKQKALAR